MASVALAAAVCFATASARAQGDDYVKVKFQAEDLGVSPARDVMERFEAFGLPTYAILRQRAE